VDTVARGGLGSGPDMVSFNSAISACDRAGQVGTVLQLLEEMMLLEEMGHKDVEPTVVSFGAALSACRRAGNKWREALGLMREMEQRSLTPSGPCFDCAIDVLEVNAQFEEADRLCAQALTSGVYRPYANPSFTAANFGTTATAATSPLTNRQHRIAAVAVEGGERRLTRMLPETTEAEAEAEFGDDAGRVEVVVEGYDWDGVDLHGASPHTGRALLRHTLRRYRPRDPPSPATDQSPPALESSSSSEVGGGGGGGGEGGGRALPRLGLLVVTGKGGGQDHGPTSRSALHGAQRTNSKFAAGSSSSSSAGGGGGGGGDGTSVLRTEARRYAHEFLLGIPGEIKEGRGEKEAGGQNRMPTVAKARGQTEVRRDNDDDDDGDDELYAEEAKTQEPLAAVVDVVGNSGRFVIPRAAVEHWLSRGSDGGLANEK